MSLTEGWAVFVSAHESALNDLVTALTTARPHLLSYGSPAFTPVSTRFDTAMAAIPFPGTGGIDWHVRFTTPHLDLYKQDDPLPPQLTLGPGAFSLTTKVQLCVDCTSRAGGKDKPGATTHDQASDERAAREAAKADRERWDETRGKARDPMCAELGVAAIGHLVPTSAGGEPAVGFALDAIELVDVTPDALESVLECLLGTVLRAVLATLSIPLSAIRVGAFTLTPTQGPLIDADAVLARGSL